MTAREIYENILADVDKYNYGTLEIPDFNKFVMDASNLFVIDKYREFETKQELTDDLSALIVRTNELNVANNQIDLPNDYMFLQLCEVKVKDNACNKETWKKCEKYTSDLKGYSYDNYYWKASAFNPKYQFFNKKLNFMVGSDANISVVKCTLEYIKKPDLIYINPANINEMVNPTYPDHVCRKIIEITVRLYRAEMGDERYQTSLQELQIRQS